jgi:predicted DNA-binding antitoxin AbrB/MazE fold protein
MTFMEDMTMNKTIEAIYENGVFRPLEPVVLPKGEPVQVTLPEITPEIQRRLTALDVFDAQFEELSEEQWQLFETTIQNRRTP